MLYRKSPHTLVLTAVSALFALLMLSACAAPLPTIHLEPYFDIDGFTAENGRWEYHADGIDATKTGIDVSENQDWIDWYAVADDGIDFAMIRVGYRGTDLGGLSADAYFDYNLSTARDAGIECGVYFFSQAITVEEAREEAQFALSLLDGADLEYPVAFDFEPNPAGVVSRAADVSSEDMTAFADEFCTIIEDAGYDAMIYGNASDLLGYDPDVLGHHKYWFARYDDPPASTSPFHLWQYSNNGSVAGIDTAVDMNLDMSAAITE